jgi:mono/diheme cytochrome c family protein
MSEPAERRYLVSAAQIRSASVLGVLGMAGLLLVLLLLPAVRPQGRFAPVSDAQHAQLLAAAQAKLAGFELRDDGGARIDIDHAIQLVAERGVDLAIVAGGVAPAAPVMGEAPPAVDGVEAYRTACAACHQATGAGVPGAFPPLAGHVGDLYVADRAIMPLTILFGIAGPIEVKGVTYASLMPPAGHLSDDVLAALANHVMTAWNDAAALGDEFEPYQPEEFAAWRGLSLTMADVHARRVQLTIP